MQSPAQSPGAAGCLSASVGVGLIAAQAVESSMGYIHINPVRHGLVDETGHWRWSIETCTASGTWRFDPTGARFAMMKYCGGKMR